jgi:glucose-6-phosphate 1-dehydrogenase
MRGRPRPDKRKSGVKGTVLVIFGSSGNLATTKLIPSLGGLAKKDLLPKAFAAVGVDRRRPGVKSQLEGFFSIRGDVLRQKTYTALARRLTLLGGDDCNVMFYLATKPQLFPGVVRRLSAAGLSRGRSGWRRIVVEKPFGSDLGSARELEKRLRSAFHRKDIFRMDHFLGKEEALSLVEFRFKDRATEALWNSRYVDHVQIIADEDTGVEERADFYDSVGVVRDMVQNHLIQLLCLVAMERPESFDAAALGRAKRKILRALRPPSAQNVVMGQYRGYGRLGGVAHDTRTPTFAAMKLWVKNTTWKQVPFYLRTGRMLARSATEVVVAFKHGGEARAEAGPMDLEFVRFCVDPLPRTVLGFRAGAPGGAKREREELTLHESSEQDEYERLLSEALKGDQSHFVDPGFSELAWRIFDPTLRAWDEKGAKPIIYEPGSWGPEGSDWLISSDGRRWADGRA